MNVYEIITAEVIRALESGVAPWRKPWRTEPPCNLVSRKEYRGINPFLLMASGHSSRYWLTFNQAKQLGGHIKRGEHSSMVTFWRVGDERIVKSADGTEQKKRSFVLRYYRVFNSWIERLKGDSRLVISAASAAQKAADYILGESANTDSADSENDSTESEQA